MAVKRYIWTAVFVVLLAISHFYLINKYNSKAVEFDFSGQLSKADIYNLRSSTKTLVNNNYGNKELPCIVNFIGRYGSSKLIMTTSMDTLAKEINLQKGRWIANGDLKEAVLGDKTADRLFRNSDVVGHSFRLYGQDYRIVGVIRNSSEIYISFDDDSRIAWSRKSIKFIVEDEKRLPLYVELLEGKLKGLGLDVNDINIYKQEAYWYINIVLAIAIFYLYKLSRRLWSEINRPARQIYLNYKEQSRTIELYKYIYKNRNDMLFLLLKLLLAGLILLIGIKCITLLQIPSTLIPNNLFSPTSYIEVIKVNLQSYINRLENGITGILLEIHIINILLLIYISIAFIIKKKASVF